MNNRTMSKSMDELIEKSFKYYREICEQYGYESDEFTIFNTRFDTRYPSRL